MIMTSDIQYIVSRRIGGRRAAPSEVLMLGMSPSELGGMGSGSSVEWGGHRDGGIRLRDVAIGIVGRHAGICTWPSCTGRHYNAGKFPAILLPIPGGGVA